MKQKILIAAILTVLIGVAGFYYLYTNLGKITAAVTEKTLEHVLLTGVDIRKARVDLTEGRIEFHHVRIGNPEGYRSAHALYFGRILVQANIPSFTSSLPVINRIELAESDIIVELSANSNNLRQLIANASRFSAEREAPPAAEAAPEDKAYRIDRILLHDTTIRVALPLSGGQIVRVPIVDLTIEDLGGISETERPAGVKPAAALQQLLARILIALRDSAGGLLSAEALGELTASIAELPGNVLGALEDAARAAGKTAGSAAGAALEAAAKTADQLKNPAGLLPGGKTESPAEQD